jgi:KUP system potassium uptake protein
MLVTTVLTFFVIRYGWHYTLVFSLFATACFAIVDAAFFSSALLKIAEGGWFPLSLGAAALVVMLTWRRGREIMQAKNRAHAIDLMPFLQSLLAQHVLRCPGTAVYMLPNPDAVPRSLLHNLSHNKVLHERVVFVTVIVEEVPRVAAAERAAVEQLIDGCWRVILRFGFSEPTDVPTALAACAGPGLELNLMETSFFLSREKIIPVPGPGGMAQWREHIFGALVRNGGSAADYFHLPANRVIEVGAQVEI